MMLGLVTLLNPISDRETSMFVHVLQRIIPYKRADFLGVFSSHDKALERKEAFQMEEHRPGVFYQVKEEEVK